ncbi:MAG TPA: hypothetical protein VG797_01055 [Phycisphaerales bacterium]|nr:hypothetical protein [Phycisphaerales bacterium]
MPQEVKSNDPHQSTERPSLQGLCATRDDERALLDALEQAFDYRGDVTITLAGGGGAKTISGYIFDRRTGQTLRDSYLRLMTATSDDKVKVVYADIERLEFTGKDTAHGKTFESWLKRYVDKKLKGERASIESEKLD